MILPRGQPLDLLGCACSTCARPLPLAKLMPFISTWPLWLGPGLPCCCCRLRWCQLHRAAKAQGRCTPHCNWRNFVATHRQVPHGTCPGAGPGPFLASCQVESKQLCTPPVLGSNGTGSRMTMFSSSWILGMPSMRFPAKLFWTWCRPISRPWHGGQLGATSTLRHCTLVGEW